MERLPEIPAEEFAPIIAELQRQELPINRYRKKLGPAGRSNAFGAVNRRCLPVDYSRLNWCRPYLYKLLLDLGAKYVPFPFTSITVNSNYSAGPHKDRGNYGNSFLVAFGDYSGGELNIAEGELSGNYSVKNLPLITDFTTQTHSVKPWIGNRYSLVYYNLKRIPLNLPPPSVKLEGNKYIFYRGDVAITRKKPLPHPLKGRSKSVQIIQQEVVVAFD
jgi:hypothetical protein